MALIDELLTLLHRPTACFVTTLMPDGSPQITQTWVDTDGEHVVINIVGGSQKSRNITRDPRVAVAIADPDNASRYLAVRGVVTEMTTDGGVEHIEQLAQKYTGGPYPWYGGRDQVRLRVTIRIDHLIGQG